MSDSASAAAAAAAAAAHTAGSDRRLRKSTLPPPGKHLEHEHSRDMIGGVGSIDMRSSGHVVAQRPDSVHSCNERCPAMGWLRCGATPAPGVSQPTSFVGAACHVPLQTPQPHVP